MTPLLTPQQYCALVGISMSKAAKDRVAGAGSPYIKCGRVVRYSAEDVAKYLETNTRKSTSDPAH
jgi:hypothetical protein